MVDDNNGIDKWTLFSVHTGASNHLLGIAREVRAP